MPGRAGADLSSFRECRQDGADIGNGAERVGERQAIEIILGKRTRGNILR
jgi:hypothetical protein